MIFFSIYILYSLFSIWVFWHSKKFYFLLLWNNLDRQNNHSHDLTHFPFVCNRNNFNFKCKFAIFSISLIIKLKGRCFGKTMGKTYFKLWTVDIKDFSLSEQRLNNRWVLPKRTKLVISSIFSHPKWVGFCLRWTVIKKVFWPFTICKC